MSFSKEWDELYSADTHLSIWPWSDLVSYVMRYARPSNPNYRVLEIGCGAGANIPFFNNLGVQYYAIEGSAAIVERLWERFPEYKETIIVGDFTKDIPFSGHFDLIVDRASLTHNSTLAIKRCLEFAYDKLRVGGKFIGIDWFSTTHSEYQNGTIDDDIFSRRGYTSGPFKSVGRVHFSDKGHLLELFDKFRLTVLEHKSVRREIPDDKFTLDVWNFVAEKPGRGTK